MIHIPAHPGLVNDYRHLPFSSLQALLFASRNKSYSYRPTVVSIPRRSHRKMYQSGQKLPGPFIAHLPRRLEFRIRTIPPIS
jgi:hypothetical protein